MSKLQGIITNAHIYRHIGDNRRFDTCVEIIVKETGKTKEEILRWFPYARPTCSIC